MSIFYRRIKGMLRSKVTEDGYMRGQTSEQPQVFLYICNPYMFRFGIKSVGTCTSFCARKLISTYTDFCIRKLIRTCKICKNPPARVPILYGFFRMLAQFCVWKFVCREFHIWKSARKIMFPIAKFYYTVEQNVLQNGEIIMHWKVKIFTHLGTF